MISRKILLCKQSRTTSAEFNLAEYKGAQSTFTLKIAECLHIILYAENLYCISIFRKMGGVFGKY